MTTTTLQTINPIKTLTYNSRFFQVRNPKKAEPVSPMKKTLMKQLFISTPEVVADTSKNGVRTLELKFDAFDMPFYLVENMMSGELKFYQDKHLLSDGFEVCKIIMDKAS